MNTSRIKWLITVALLALTVALTACGGGDEKPTATTAPRRTAVPARAPTKAGAPTQDQLDDSSANADQSTDTSGDGAEPTRDQLDDSSANTGTPKTPSGKQTNASSGPQIQNGQVVLSDTSWVLENEQVYRFCKSGRWDVVQGGDTVVKTGTFQLAGENVTVKNNADQKTIKYQMAWKPDTETLELNDGNTTLTLKYGGSANCS